MSIKTIDRDRSPKEIKEELRAYHEATFEFIGVKDAVFVPKMAYRPTGKQELHISFFPSELKKGDDLYIEFTSRDFEPEDIERKLYKWKFNPHYDAEYEKVQNKDNIDFRYLVPVEELIVIPHKKEKEMIIEEFALPDAEHDLPLDQLTIRDLAAIMLKKPVSRKEWLNDLLK